jgi:hypothetical protein
MIESSFILQFSTKSKSFQAIIEVIPLNYPAFASESGTIPSLGMKKDIQNSYFLSGMLWESKEIWGFARSITFDKLKGINTARFYLSL